MSTPLPTIIRTPLAKGKAYRYETLEGEIITARSTRLYTHASVYRRNQATTVTDYRRPRGESGHTVAEEGSLVFFLHSRADIAAKGSADGNRITTLTRVPGVIEIDDASDPFRVEIAASSLTGTPLADTLAEPGVQSTPTHIPTEDQAMPTKTAPKAKTAPARKTAAAKPAAKTTARKPAAKTATKAASKASTNGHARAEAVTHDQMLKLVPTIVKRLKAGETMTVLRGEYGAGVKIRKALTERGYNTKGEKIETETISTAGGAAATAKRVAAKRAEGWPWYKVALATGKSETELRTLLTEQGYDELATGRVIKEPVAKPVKATTKKAAAQSAPKAAAKTAAKAKPVSKAKPAAKVAVKKTVVKPKPRRVAPRASADPS